MRTQEHRAVAVGVDDSDAGRLAMRWAAREALSRSEALLLVRAVPVPLEELTRVHLPSEQPVMRHGSVQQELAALATECRRMFPELLVRTRVQMGHPASVLREETEQMGMVVLGPPPLSRTRRVLLGSTAGELVRNAHVPVVVVRGPEADRPIRRVVVGVDGSPTSGQAITFAHDLAYRHSATLTALMADATRAPDALPPNRGWRYESDFVEANQRLLAECVAGVEQSNPDVEMHQEVSLEPPTEALLQAAEKADLLVIGSRGRHIVRATTLGSTSHALVHYADCAVAVVR
jgi:nucleotide-binding universal stress UspA family protein